MENKKDFDHIFANNYGRKLFNNTPDTIGQAYVVQGMRAQWEKDQQDIKSLSVKFEIALVALKSVARNDVNWSHAIVEKALKDIEESWWKIM